MLNAELLVTSNEKDNFYLGFPKDLYRSSSRSLNNHENLNARINEPNTPQSNISSSDDGKEMKIDQLSYRFRRGKREKTSNLLESGAPPTLLLSGVSISINLRRVRAFPSSLLSVSLSLCHCLSLSLSLYPVETLVPIAFYSLHRADRFQEGQRRELGFLPPYYFHCPFFSLYFFSR